MLLIPIEIAWNRTAASNLFNMKREDRKNVFFSFVYNVYGLFMSTLDYLTLPRFFFSLSFLCPPSVTLCLVSIYFSSYLCSECASLFCMPLVSCRMNHNIPWYDNLLWCHLFHIWLTQRKGNPANHNDGFDYVSNKYENKSKQQHFFC